MSRDRTAHAIKLSTHNCRELEKLINVLCSNQMRVYVHTQGGPHKPDSFKSVTRVYDDVVR